MIIAGHSKGGAEAIDVAGLMVLDGHPPERLVTCGCPRVHLGSRLEYVLKDVPQAHYVRKKDVVPRIPTGWSRPGPTIEVGENYCRPWPNVWDHRVKLYIDEAPEHDRAALEACALAYEMEPIFKAGTSEAIIIGPPSAPILAIRGTTFDGWGLIFRDVLVDALAYPWHHPGLGWVHKGFLRGRGLGEGGAIGLYKQTRRFLF